MEMLSLGQTKGDYHHRAQNRISGQGRARRKEGEDLDKAGEPQAEFHQFLHEEAWN